MYCDLYLPFPTSSPGAGPSTNNASKKGKGKASPAPVEQKARTCWDGVAAKDKEEVDKVFALAGHCKCHDYWLDLRPACFNTSPISGLHDRSKFGAFNAVEHRAVKSFCEPGASSRPRPTIFRQYKRFETVSAVIQNNNHAR
jgi:hypothetical protein